jgi:hypothetical protein
MTDRPLEPKLNFPKTDSAEPTLQKVLNDIEEPRRR